MSGRVRIPTDCLNLRRAVGFPPDVAADSLQFEGNFVHLRDGTAQLHMLSGRFPAWNLRRRFISQNPGGSHEHGHRIASFGHLDVR
jgi:hypothetical protein